MERRLADCIHRAMRAGEDPRQRLSAATKSAAYSLLDKPWKGMVQAGLLAEKPPEEGKEGGPNPIRRRPSVGGRRRRVTGRQSTLPKGVDQLPAIDELTDSSKYPSPFRLASLLFHRAFNKEEWKEEYESTLTAIRLECSSGIHPVWAQLADASPVLAEIGLHPSSDVVEKGQEGPSEEWYAQVRIDPMVEDQLATLLKSSMPFDLSSEVELSLRLLGDRLESNQSSTDLTTGVPDELFELKAPASIIPALVLVADNSPKGLEMLTALHEEGEGAIQMYAGDQISLLRLRDGHLDEWDRCRMVDGADNLSEAMRREAWTHPTPEASELESSELKAGLEVLELLDENEVGEAASTLNWHLASALMREGEKAVAGELMLNLPLTTLSQLEVVLKLLRGGDDELLNWLDERLDGLEPAGLKKVIEDVQAPNYLRGKAATILHGVGGKEWRKAAETTIPLFVESVNIPLLAAAITAVKSGHEKYPLESMLACHLQVANTDAGQLGWCLKLREQLQSMLDEGTTSSSFSPLANTLLGLMEGGKADLELVAERLDESGYRSFGQVRRALMEDGDGLVPETVLSTFEESVAETKFTSLEGELFGVVIASLKLNRAASLLQRGGKDDFKRAGEVLEEILEIEPVRERFLEGVRELVLEYSIGVQNLADWYRDNQPSSPWHTLAKAAIAASEGDHQTAAHNYKTAAAHSHFNFEISLQLYRSALIHFAHASRWGEALELLDDQPSILSVITEKFQLYLRVSDDHERGQEDAARRRLVDFVREEEVEQSLDDEGNAVSKTLLRPSEGRLELLMNYPFEHEKHLPKEPYHGRVVAALASQKRTSRKKRSESENRFQYVISNGTVDDLYQLAEEYADEDPVRALMMLERAISGGRFEIGDQKSLFKAQRQMFKLKEAVIPIRQRRQLRNLSLPPLVVVDTNLLVDAMRDRISSKLELNTGVAVDIGGSRAFHRQLHTHHHNKVLKVFIPNTVRKQILNFTPNRMRSAFYEFHLPHGLWEEVITPEVLTDMTNEMLENWSSWKPPSEKTFYAGAENYRKAVEEFLQEHEDVYSELTTTKNQRGPNKKEKRVALGSDEEIYPDAGDISIMLVAAKLADDCINNIGSIVTASRDGDFTIIGRAFEERFGFGVAKNARELRRWLPTSN